jgi:hypothetical protein
MPRIERDDVEVYYEVFGRGTPLLFLSETTLLTLPARLL